MYLEIPEVFHVGTLEAAHRTQRFSMEGDTLSVSEVPEDWQHIAKLTGPTWELYRPQGRFFDMHDEKARALLDAELLAAGLVCNAQAYRLAWFDDEANAELSTLFRTREQALAESEEDEPNVTLVDVLSATPALREAYPLLSHDDFACVRDIAATVLARGQSSPLLADVDGLWWDEDLDPDRLSAPRGCIFPHRLALWEKTIVG